MLGFSIFDFRFSKVYGRVGGNFVCIGIAYSEIDSTHWL